MTIPVDDRQFAFWRLRRDGLANIQIAERFHVSRQAVSKAVLTMDEKVGETLLEMARANRIGVEKLSTQKGVLFGRSVPFDADAVIFISAKHGMQVWYEHEGDCSSCSMYTQCIEMLWDFAEELKIPLEQTADPTLMADELFVKLKELL